MKVWTFALLVVFVFSLSAWTAVRDEQEWPRQGWYEVDCVFGAKKAGLRCHAETRFFLYVDLGAAPGVAVNRKPDSEQFVRIECTNGFEFESQAINGQGVAPNDDLLLQASENETLIGLEFWDLLRMPRNSGSELTVFRHGREKINLEGQCELDFEPGPAPTVTVTATAAAIGG